MKLHFSALSPYARKCRIIARLKDLDVEEIAASSDGANGYAAHVNPLGKIPVLEVTDKVVLYDSPVICEYLDSRNDPILPASGDGRWHELRLHALGDGLSDAVYNYRYEIVRDDVLHWDSQIQRHETAIRLAVKALENSMDGLGVPWTFGNIAIVCALDYADFRAGHIDWRSLAPNLAQWHEKFQSDHIWQATNDYK